MLQLEPLEAREVLSPFITIAGIPNSATGWAKVPGHAATVRVYFGAEPPPMRGATRAALAGLNAEFRQAGVGVHFVVVATNTQANVVIRAGQPPVGEQQAIGVTAFSSARPDGSTADGHPYFRWDGRVRILMKANAPWYFGRSPLVPGDALDFESCVMHELGHSLGLDHNNARNDVYTPDHYSTMNAVLPYGTARRHFADVDLAVLRDLYG